MSSSPCSELGHRVNDFWPSFSIPPSHICPSIVKPTLAWLTGASFKAYWACSGRGVCPLKNWLYQQVCVQALDSITGDHVYKVFTEYSGRLWSMIFSVLCFSTKYSGMIHQEVWNIFKIPPLLFSHSQQGCPFFFLMWSCLLLRISSLSWFLASPWDMMPSRKPAVPIWESASAFMLSCRLLNQWSVAVL